MDETVRKKNLEPWAIVYWLVLAVAIVLENMFVYPILRRRELTRRTLGIATVMGIAYPLALARVIDRRTWETIFYGFGVAGAITAYWHIVRDARQAQLTREEIETDDIWQAW